MTNRQEQVIQLINERFEEVAAEAISELDGISDQLRVAWSQGDTDKAGTILLQAIDAYGELVYQLYE